MAVFRKVLVANRGEIAVRVLRAARGLGLRTVTVFSDADEQAVHVDEADEAVRIGPAAASQSYLAIEAILGAAQRTGADAIHPGYGFLSENAAFAKACGDAGLTFVGPPPAAVRLMGDKAAAKAAAIAAGVPCVPGSDDADADDAALIRAAASVGFPLFVKAAAGGGGRGMRRVDDEQALPAALAGARHEAQQAFSNGALLLERVVASARHVEIQVFADAHGNVLHLGERECSVQRRHQKVIEECPSPAVDPALRERMGGAAVALARAVDYRGAGTVEFLVDHRGFYFLEMNTRLQVEHPVTEMVTGVDLVAWQFRVAQGEPLPLTQDQVRMQGHAIEARLYSEDPAAGFVPRTGEVAVWRPPVGPGIRVDAGIGSGRTVGAHYDPLLAKIIAHGADRETARLRLVGALERLVAVGPGTNRQFLLSLLEDERFVAGRFTTDLIDRHGAQTWTSSSSEPWHWAVAVVVSAQGDVRSDGWASAGEPSWTQTLTMGDESRALRVTVCRDHRWIVEVDGRSFELRCQARDVGEFLVEIDGVRRSVVARRIEDRMHVAVLGRDFVVESPHTPQEAAAGRSGGDVQAPTAGRVLHVPVQVGDEVEAGATVATLEAMKMEHRVLAPAAGRVQSVAVRPGDQVTHRQVLLTLSSLDPLPREE